MPTLNKLTCTILLPPTDTPLPEYKRKYLDSSVSVYVSVPEIPILQAAPAFNIQLRSEDEWIAPGLAMFVYIDGYYQCNRSKRTPLTGSKALELRVRQKEEKLAGGSGGFVGREWRWVMLDADQANGVSDSHNDLQDHVGKIEVVVLRCDAEQALAEEPYGSASDVKASVKAPSAKAPSAKAPSAKAPSAKASAGKPATATSEFGGLFGLFDGACDFGLDGTGDARPGSIPHTDFAGRQWDPAAGLHRWSESPLSNNADYGPPPSIDDSGELHNLDGPGYNHPGVVVDNYGQPYAQRVPYYHTSTNRRPRRDDNDRFRNAGVGYVQGGATSTPPLARGQQVMGYAPDGTPIVARPSRQQPRGPPIQEARRYPRIIAGPDGQQYIDVSGQEQHQERTQHVSGELDHLPQGYSFYVDSMTGERYAAPGYAAQPRPANVPQQQQQRQHHQQQQRHQRYQPEQTSNQPQRNIDPEHQRSQIFKLGDEITRVFKYDYRLVAAAVPHIPFLKTHHIEMCTPDQYHELQHQLNLVLSSAYFPNGEKIAPLLDPRDEEPGSKTPTQRRVTPVFANEKARAQNAAYDDTAPDLDWVDRAAGEYKHIHKAFQEEERKEEEERKKRHDEKKHRRKHDDKVERRDDDRSRHSRQSQHSSSQSRHSTSNRSERDNQEAKTEDRHKGSSNNGGWGDQADAKVEATGNWDAPDEQTNPTKQPDDNNNNTYQTNPNPHTDGYNEAKAPSHHNSNRSRASNKTNRPTPSLSTTSTSTSTSTSKTTNPHAAIQHYFNVLHPTTNPNPASKTHQNQHQTPLPRTPYLYPPTHPPHLPVSNLGTRSHAVLAGKGAEYTHATLRPKYLDTMERPYAVFVFEYRSVEKLGEILGRGRRGREGLEGDLMVLGEEVGRGVLMGLSRERLVAEVLRGRGMGMGGGGGGVGGEMEKKEDREENKKKTRSTKDFVGDWAADAAASFPAAAAAAAAAPAAVEAGRKATTAMFTTHHQHQGHDNRSHKSGEKAAKGQSISGWAFETPEQQGGGGSGGGAGGFVGEPEVNANVSW